MEGIIVAGINIVEKDSKILLIKEKSNIVKGKWNLPGGALKRGEKIISCAVREGREETGLELKTSYLVGIYNQLLPAFKNSVISFIFKSDIIGGELILSRKEVEDLNWFSLKQIEQLEEEKLLAFPYVIRVIHDYKAGKKFPLGLIIDLTKKT